MEADFKRLTMPTTQHLRSYAKSGRKDLRNFGRSIADDIDILASISNRASYCTVSWDQLGNRLLHHPKVENVGKLYRLTLTGRTI
jgi:hypothetical protein